MEDLYARYMPTAELAQRLGLTGAAIAWRVRQGYLTPAMKAPGIRGAYLFDRAAMEQLLDEREREAS